MHVWATLAIVGYGGGVASGQPIDPAVAGGPYSGGGISLSGDDIRRIAWGDGEPGAIGGGPRGGGGNVLIVECGGAFGFSTIQGAIDAAVDGDVVVVLPNDCTAEGRWFENLVIADKAIRLQSANPADAALVDATIVDGSADGSVVYIEGEAASGAVVDGLTLTNGHGPNSSVGGGITCYLAAPTIRRCAIRENASAFGGGLRVISSESPVVESCRFVGNAAIPANGNGSAVAAGQSAFPLFSDCSFSGHGGVPIWLTAVASESCASPTNCSSFANCRFEGNDCLTLIRGDALVFDGCEFVGNSGSLLNGDQIEISDCRIEGNTSIDSLIHIKVGGRVLDSDFVGNTSMDEDVVFLGPTSQVSGCSFDVNQAPRGSVLSFQVADATMSDCSVTNNACLLSPVRATHINGARIERCYFIGNSASTMGGALHVVVQNPNFSAFIRDCQFIRNSSLGSGGAIHTISSNIIGCQFVGNMSNSAGAVFCGPGSGILDHCTIIGNRANVGQGGVFGGRIWNSIIYENRNSFGNGELAQISSDAEIAFSLVQNLVHDLAPPCLTNQDVNNIALDPRFVDPGHWDDMGTPEDLSDDVFVAGDYHLLPDSPCIDGGDPAFIPDDGATDFDGEPRVMSCRVDMGVDEFTQDDVDVVGDFDGDGAVTVDDLPVFVDVTLAPLGLGVCRADVNGDGIADGRDVAAMVAILIGL